LGYTTFAMADLEVVDPLDGEQFRVAVTVANTGARPGRHVIQINAVQTADTGRDVPHLVGFQTVALDAVTTARVVVDCSVRPIQRWAEDGFTLAATAVTIRAGGYAGDPAAVEATLAVPS
jgi:hypothetical protein